MSFDVVLLVVGALGFALGLLALWFAQREEPQKEEVWVPSNNTSASMQGNPSVFAAAYNTAATVHDGKVYHTEVSLLQQRISNICQFTHCPDDVRIEDHLKHLMRNVGRDTARLDLLEEYAPDGVWSIGMELDGGVHVTFDPVGGEQVAAREKNTVRAALDALLDHGPLLPQGGV